MMVSYPQVKVNILKTWVLMALFLGLVILLGWFLSYYFNSPQILWWALIFSLVLNFLSYWYSDKIVLKMSKAKPAKPEEFPELYQIVKELTQKAKLPMPRIYIVPESAPNAFATGRNSKNAAVAVTEGLLKKLNRSELEGVIAHELSHIGNRDILLQTVVVVLVGLVVIVSDMFLRMAFWGRIRRSEREVDQLGAVLMILGLIFVLLAPIVAQLIHFAISRKREFLADASGALLTRSPESLAGALEKIAKDPIPLRSASNATAHLYIANPFKGRQKRSWLTKLFMTHPPVEERIRALKSLKI